MMSQQTGSLTVWCLPNQPPQTGHPTVFWDRFQEASAGDEHFFSTPAGVNADKLRLRSIILSAFSRLEVPHTQGESRPEGRSQNEALFWAMSFPSQFSLQAESVAYDLVRTRALLDLLEEKRPKAVLAVEPPRELFHVLLGWCAKNSTSLSIAPKAYTPVSLLKKCDISEWRALVPPMARGYWALANHAAMSLTIKLLKPKPRIENVDNVFVGYVNPKQVNGTLGERKNTFWGSLVDEVEGSNQRSVFLYIDQLSRNRRELRSTREMLLRSNKKCAQTRHGLLVDFMGLMSFVRAIRWYHSIRRSARAITEEAVRKSSIELGFDTSWWFLPVAKDAFRGSTAMTNAIWLSAFDEVSRRLKARRLFYLMENQAWEKALLRSMGTQVESFGFIHTSVRFWDLRYFFPIIEKSSMSHILLPGRVLVGSEVDHDKLKEGGLEEELIGEVEALRYLYISDSSRFAKAFRGPRTVEEILIVGDYDITFSYRQVALANKIFLGMLDRSGLRVRFRPHPSRSMQLATLIPGITISVDRSILEDLEDATVVVCSPLSSAVIDAEASGLPTIIVPDPSFFTDYLVDSANIVICTSAEEILPMIKSLLTRFNRTQNTSIPNGLFLDSSLPRWNSLILRGR